jgi:hypothetical protein
VQVVLDNLPLVLVLAAGVFAPLTGWFATGRQRQPVVWFLYGALLGPIALALLAIAPPGRCPACDWPATGWSSRCPNCGTRFRSTTTTPGDAPPGLGLPTIPLVNAPLDAVVGRRTRRLPARSPMALGRAPVPELVPDPAVAAGRVPVAATAGEVLSTGIYLSGNARLEIGGCYALSRVGDRWRVFGPVDAGQITVRHEGPLASLDVTAMEDRVILSAAEGRSSLAIVLRPIGGMRAEDLEHALAPGRSANGASGVAS